MSLGSISSQVSQRSDLRLQAGCSEAGNDLSTMQKVSLVAITLFAFIATTVAFGPVVGVIIAAVTAISLYTLFTSYIHSHRDSCRFPWVICNVAPQPATHVLVGERAHSHGHSPEPGRHVPVGRRDTPPLPPPSGPDGHVPVGSRAENPGIGFSWCPF